MDLTRLDVYEEFVKTAEVIKDRFKKRKDYKPRKLINAVVFNIMYKTKPYDIIRAVFEVPRGYVVARTNIKPMQIQLCVRNRDCIKTIREAKCYGT